MINKLNEILKKLSKEDQKTILYFLDIRTRIELNKLEQTFTTNL